MDDNKLEAKLLKIKALAERGEGGEKEAAIKMYHKLLKKYDIDEKALQKDKLSKHWFTYETDIEENLLVQIFYMVTGDPEYFRGQAVHAEPSADAYVPILRKLKFVFILNFTKMHSIRNWKPF